MTCIVGVNGLNEHKLFLIGFCVSSEKQKLMWLFQI